jgi:hypothetical protein
MSAEDIIKDPGPLTTEQEEKFHKPLEKWSDDFALKVAKEDFQSAEVYRTNSHETRWQAADSLYLGSVHQKVWEGTKIPRSSLPVFLIFSHVESLIPRVITEIFGETAWFEASPHPGTTQAQARATRDLMLVQGDMMGIRETVRRVIKSAFIYGNGISELCWIYQETEKLRYEASFVPVMQQTRDPITGEPMSVPTRETRRVVKENKVKVKINRPVINYVSLKDFYIDPNCESPNVQDARFAAKRAKMSIDELMAYDGVTGFKIPSKLGLLMLLKNLPTADGDNTKQMAEMMRGAYWDPSQNTSVDPNAKKLEVVAYYTKDRCVWIVNRCVVIYNQPNPYGFIPFYNYCYTDVLDRFYALGISDIGEGEQRFQEGVTNARIDELSLSIHTPKAKKRGAYLSPHQMRTRPNQVWELDDPQKDLVPMFPQNITQQAFMEIEASENRAQKADGVTDLSVMGVPTQGGNSANRTATGINRQSEASTSRINYLVENFENQWLEPVLYDWHFLNTRNLDPLQVEEIMGADAQLVEIDPLQVMNADIKFSMRASRRMKSKTSLLQLFPLVSQTFLNPEFLGLLAKQQKKTIDVVEVSNLLTEAFSYAPRGAFFRDMSPEEVEAMNAPPQPDPTKIQLQRERMEAMNSMAQRAEQVDLIKTTLREMGIVEKSEKDIEKEKEKAKLKPKPALPKKGKK